MKSTVFYSWQSDLDVDVNKNFIQEALDHATHKFKKDDSITVTPVVDRDTRNTPGSPDIATTIFAKIDACDVFVCDVSIINPNKEPRPTPNPNVLVELGYAVAKLGWHQVVMIYNTASGPVEELPFDLRSKRILKYNAVSGSEAIATERKQLGDTLHSALKLIYIYIKNSSALNKILEPFEDEFTDLNSSDIALFIFACELSLKSGNSTLSSEELKEKANELHLTTDDFYEVINILLKRKLIENEGSSSGIITFSITPKGFALYGKRYIYDFASILANALITIHKDKVQTEAELASALGVSPVLTDYLLQILEERKFYESPKYLWSNGALGKITAEGKRLIDQIS